MRPDWSLLSMTSPMGPTRLLLQLQKLTRWGSCMAQHRWNVTSWVTNIMLQVKCQTLSDCVNGTHKSQHEISEASRHLNDAQKDVMNKWLVQASRMATPLCPHNLHAHVFDLTGKLPRTNWPQKYLTEWWHLEGIKTKLSWPEICSELQLNKCWRQGNGSHYSG